MRTNSLHSTQLPDPYRIKQFFVSKVDTLPAPIHQSDSSRTYSYLPYTNHAPDFAHSRTALYFEEDAQTITSTIQIDLINTEHTLERPLSQLHGSLPSRVTSKEGRDRQTIIGGVVLSTWILLFLIAYICWPRIPRIHIVNKKADRIGDPADWGPRQQPYFKAEWQLNITLDNHSSFVPTLIQTMHTILRDRDTLQPFAWSTTGPFQLMPQKTTVMTIDFQVDYESSDITDVTFKNLYNACGPQIPAESPALNITMQTTIHVSGLIWPFVVNLEASDIGGLYCPLN